MKSTYTQGSFFKRANIASNQDNQTLMAKTSLWGAQQYITQNSKNAMMKKMFGDSLRRQLSDRIQKIDELPFYQLVSKFNFLVHPAQLPAPFIISIIAQQLDVNQTQSVTIESLQKMNPDVLQDMIYRALHQSIAFGQPYLSKALQYWFQMTNAARKQDQNATQGTSKKSYFGESNNLFGLIGKSLNTAIQNMQTIYKKGTAMIANSALSIWQYLIGVADVDPDFANRFAEATSKLKQYGKFLVDGWFIQNNALRTFINGDIYYIVPSFQVLRFKIKGSFLQIFAVKKGQMRKIQEAQFDQSLLRAILKSRVAEQNIQILKDYKRVRNPIQGYQESVNAFNSKYLNTNTYKAKQKQLQDNSTQISKKYGVKIPDTGQVTLKSIQQYLQTKSRASTYSMSGIGSSQSVTPKFVKEKQVQKTN